MTAWGYYYDLSIPETFRPMYVPAGLSNVTAIAGGDTFAVALKSDGKVVAWGWGSSDGQTNVPSNLSNVVAITAGVRYSLALKNDGSIVGWGYTPYGFPTNLSNVVAITADLALKADGTVATWGANLGGPAAVPPGLSGVIAIAANGLALKSDGTVVSWDFHGNLRTNTPPGLANVTAIASGFSHYLALKSDGTVVAWSDGTLWEGQIVPAGLSNVVGIAAGHAHSLALKADGSVVAWGAGTNVNPSLFSLHKGQSIVPENLSNVTAIAGGTTFSLAIQGDGSPFFTESMPFRQAYAGAMVQLLGDAVGASPLAHQWMFNGANIPNATNLFLTLPDIQLGQSGIYTLIVSNNFGVATNSTEVIVTPVLISLQPQSQRVFLGRDVQFSVQAQGIDVGYQWLFNGAPLSGATSSLWSISNVGFNRAGLYSVILTNVYGSVTSSAARLDVDQIVAWGSGFYGETSVPIGLTNIVAVAAGSSHSLALRENGTITGWGAGTSNTGFNSEHGQAISPWGLTNAIAIAAGNLHSVVLTDNGKVIAWGRNLNGQTNVPANLSNVVAISAGFSHNLALKADGTMVAWGYNAYGQGRAPGWLTNIVAIDCGGYHNLALRRDGVVFAWGYNEDGETNTPPDATNIMRVAAGGKHSLALKEDGTIVSWGDNSKGQINVPPALTNVIHLSAGCTVDAHSLALKVDGTVTAWGWNDFGQTIAPPGLTNVIGIAANELYSLALIGYGPRPQTGLLSIRGRDSEGFHLSIATQVGRVYGLEYKDSLVDTVWASLPLVAGNGKTQTLTDPLPISSQRFYRVRQW